MGYYHIKLLTGAKQLYNTILPWGKYEYQNIPTMLCNSPNTFQENISEPFKGFDMVRVYIDDVLVITKNNFQDHLDNLERENNDTADALGRIPSMNSDVTESKTPK